MDEGLDSSIAQALGSHFVLKIKLRQFHFGKLILTTNISTLASDILEESQDEQHNFTATSRPNCYDGIWD